MEDLTCTIEEIDVSPVQIQGPKSKALMKDLCGDQVDFDNMPFYGLAEVKVGWKKLCHFTIWFLR
jgi:aminomethyltransferase